MPRKGVNKMVEAGTSAGHAVAGITHAEFMLAAQNGDVNKLRRAIGQKRIKLNKTDNDRNTALMLAAQNGNAEAVQVLIAAGADIATGNKNKYTALMRAAQNGHVNIVNMLLAKSRELEEEDYRKVVASGEIQNARFELDRGLVISGEWAYQRTQAQNRSIVANTALMLAAKNGHADVVKILLENGASADAAYDNGVTVLMAAAQNGHAGVVRLLTEAGADIHKYDKSGTTDACRLAAQNRHRDVVKILIAAGKDIWASSPYNRSTVFGWCIDKKLPNDTISFLLKESQSTSWGFGQALFNDRGTGLIKALKENPDRDPILRQLCAIICYQGYFSPNARADQREAVANLYSNTPVTIETIDLAFLSEYVTRHGVPESWVAATRPDSLPDCLEEFWKKVKQDYENSKKETKEGMAVCVGEILGRYYGMDVIHPDMNIEHWAREPGSDVQEFYQNHPQYGIDQIIADLEKGEFRTAADLLVLQQVINSDEPELQPSNLFNKLKRFTLSGAKYRDSLRKLVDFTRGEEFAKTVSAKRQELLERKLGASENEKLRNELAASQAQVIALQVQIAALTRQKEVASCSTQTHHRTDEQIGGVQESQQVGEDGWVEREAKRRRTHSQTSQEKQ